MASQRPFAANTSLGLKLTPSNSPFSRTPRSPNKTRLGLYEDGLSLKKIIGTTVSSPNALDSLPSSRVFAYTAGAAAIVVNLPDSIDRDNIAYSQRFFRARPTAVPLYVGSFPACAPSTPTHTANDGRNRIGNLRDVAIPYSPSTPHTSLDFGDSPSSKTWTSRERIKAATCVSISGDGRYLAVGETGYSPRVLIFALQDASSDVPLAILSEHTFGVRAVAFSPKQNYLASLGTPNDGFLYVWSINQRTGAAKLHSSNKCTSSVKQMIWLGDNIVTVGTRHVKVWRVDNRSVSPVKPKFALDGTPQPAPVIPALKTLTGRNVLLGPLVEATFTAVGAVSEETAIVCSDRGDICLLDDSNGQKLMRLANTGFSITCLAVNMQSRTVKIGGMLGQVKSMSLDDLLTPSTPPESPLSLIEKMSTRNETGLCAMRFAADTLVTIDSKHMIEIVNEDLKLEDERELITPFPAHGGAVLGVIPLAAPNSRNSAFLTWSANGIVVFWDLDGCGQGSLKIEMEQNSIADDDPVNQCQVIRASKDLTFLVSGDRYGVLRVIDPVTQACTFDVRAHLTDIQDIAIWESGDIALIASCGRDRTVQLFQCKSGPWELIQTLEDHAASVCGVFFAENGEKLISCSTDRTIHIRQIVKTEVDGQDMMGAVPVRIITLKASPVSMIPCPGANFVVSLLDRTVATYEISSGRLVASFKATDSDGGEAVVLDALRIGNPGQSGKPTILASISGTDKSVRIYDVVAGSFLDREWGHTAAVTDVALLETTDSDQKTLVSTGSDGTIMIWDLSPRSPDLLESPDFSREESPPKESLSVRPPLRRVLSRAEIAEFQRASPVSTPSGRASPPRTVRRKTSRYGLSTQSPSILPPMPSGSKYLMSASEDSSSRKGSPRNRSRSPPGSPKGRESRRSSLADTRIRTKSNSNLSEFGTLNMATEQACRTLRAYRRKLASSEAVKDELLKELEQELRLTALAVGERSLKSKAITETIMTGLLDQYSSRLVSMFDEKLRLTRTETQGETEEVDTPKTTGALEDTKFAYVERRV
ncbi:WD repeat protein-like protein [Bisporella sp. PMI_857]|nr:WD repeat protein-like protein [Bisporella sp. PMI_857]